MTDLNLLRKVSDDRALGSAMLFSNRHSEATPPFHIEIIDLYRCADEFVLIEALREGGKTTLAEEFWLMEGCFGNFNYLLLLGETYSKACQRLEAIDKEARTNVKLHHLFGGPVLARKSIENRVWFKSGAMIEAVGWEQELQGFKYHEHRPDRAYLDDVENLERVRDRAAVDASLKKLYLELIPAMDKKHRKIRMAQTPRADYCMASKIRENPRWLCRSFPIANGDIDDPKTRAIWPARYPMEWVRNERDDYQAAGMLREFMQAYMLVTSDTSAKPFREDMLGALEVSPWHWMPRYAIYDPSRTTNERRTREAGKSDRTGRVVVSRMGSKILVHESAGAFWKPDELIADLFRVNAEHHPARIGVEKNSLDDWIMQPIRLEMLKRGATLPIRALQAPQDRSKEEFILGLQPFFEAHDIVLVGGTIAHPQLVAEITNFPQGPRDILNALAYSLRMFSGQAIYQDFGPANIGDAPKIDRGETVYVGFSATAVETVCVAVLRNGRRLHVAMDATASGPDAVAQLAFELRTAFPTGDFSCWVPATVAEQYQRVALVPQLRAARIAPQTGEREAVARGCLSDRLRTEWQGKRMLLVDRGARNTLNALGSAYALPTERGGRMAGEPEPGTSRLLGEALECMVAMLDRSLEAGASGIPTGANVGFTPQGVAYVTANPARRAS